MYKKLIILLSLSLISTNLFSKDLKESMPPYVVEKDEFDASIPEGEYILEGKVLDIHTNTYVNNVNIEVENVGRFSLDKSGAFKLTLPAKVKIVSFSKSGFYESYFENYEVKSQHRIKVVIYVNSSLRKNQIQVEKPIVYAYNATNLDLSITLKSVGKLQFVYPAFSDSTNWNMTLKNNQFVDKKGNSYPYLFWDSKQEDIQYLIEQDHHAAYRPYGEVVKRENVVPYLDSVLTYLGFNDTEKTDFITYWGPRLIKKEYAFIQFQTQDECNEYAQYEISPKPDHFNRLFLFFDHLDKVPWNVDFVKQDLKPFSRSGFHMLEWGGSELPLADWIRNL